MIGAVVAGLLLALGSPPHNAWFLALFGLVLTYHATDCERWQQRAKRGWIVGAVMFVCNLAWVRQFSIPGWIILTGIEACFIALATTMTPPTSRSMWRVAAFPAAIFLALYLHDMWPLGGLPTATFTTGQASSPLAAVVSLVGEPGLAFTTSAIAASLLVLLIRRQIIALIPIVAVVLLTVAGARVHIPQTGTLRVAAVQAGGKLAIPRSQQNPGQVFVDHYRETAYVNYPTDLILWPEDVIQVEQPISTSEANTVMAQVASVHHASVIAGIVQISSDQRFRNIAVAWSANGSIADTYNKVHRVPFGEYLPERSLLRHIISNALVPYDAIPGNSSPVLDVDNRRYAMAISYESLFARHVRAGVRDGGELVLIPTNAASYTSHTVVATQKDAARLRARETGRWVVQAAPTGLSLIINPQGNVEAQSNVGGAAVLQMPAGLANGQTPYVRWGDIPCLIMSIALLIVTWRRPITQRFTQAIQRDRPKPAPDLAHDVQTKSC